MTSLEHLRLAVALGNTVPGAELHLLTDHGEKVVVSHHPAADINPCAMRRVAAASACPNQPDLSKRVVDITVGGALVDLGGGVFSSLLDEVEQRWVVTLLDPHCVADMMDGVGLDAVPDSAMRATFKPDAALGVTVLAIGVKDARYRYALDEIAAQAAAACFVEELRCSALAIAHSNARKEGEA
jgi:hypothetical protein